MLPVLAALLFGVFEVGRMMQSWVTIQHAVDEAERFARPTGEIGALPPTPPPAVTETATPAPPTPSPTPSHYP